MTLGAPDLQVVFALSLELSSLTSVCMSGTSSLSKAGSGLPSTSKNTGWESTSELRSGGPLPCICSSTTSDIVYRRAVRLGNTRIRVYLLSG